MTRSSNRLTDKDRLTVRSAIEAAIRGNRVPPVKDIRFVNLRHEAASSIGCSIDDLRQSEINWIEAQIVAIDS